MINLMYLVLTALLALNVSSEILNAFKIVNKSIQRSNETVSDKNKKVYQDFEDNLAVASKRDRVKPLYDKAKEAKAASDEMFNYIDSLKSLIITQSGGYLPDNPTELKNESDIETPTRIMIEGYKGADGSKVAARGDELKTKLMAIREKFLSYVDNPAKKAELAAQLPLRIDTPVSENNPQGDWSVGHFRMVPVMAAVTILTKFQSDVKNTESTVIKYLFDQVDASVQKFDAIRAIAVPKNAYVMQGQKIEADIMLAAYNTTVNPRITGPGSITVKDGVGTFASTASGVGMQTVKGTLTVDGPSGPEQKNWEFQYMVGSAGASIQLDKMNVFYIGVPNPITVSAAGVPLENIALSIPGANLSSTAKGKYDVTVGQPGKVTATVSAKMPDGTSKTMGTMEIRVKRIPDPQARIAGKASGYIPANVLKAQTGVIAALDGFDFDAKFQVISFRMGHTPRRGGDYWESTKLATNAYFTDEMKARLNVIKPGDKVFFDDIKARGPDGSVRSLNGITFTIQ
jgi:gliding motility-associated protein GldM